MKINRGKIKNLLFLVVVFLILFTPVGTYVKVFANRLISFAPSILSESNRHELSTYRWGLEEVNTNKHVNFSNSKDKVVFVSFWATWCPPCIAEMPSIQALYTDYGTKVDFYLVSNESSLTIKNFLLKNNYTLPVYNELSATPRELSSRSLPTTFVITKEGKIIIKKTGVANWNSEKVRALLDKELSR